MVAIPEEPAKGRGGVKLAAARRRSARHALATLLPPVAFCLLLVIGWEAMARAMHSPLLPGVAAIAGELRRILMTGAALTQIAVTLGRIVGGFALAFVVAVAIGIGSARSALIRRFFEPALVLGLTVPGLVWALLCVIWFGISPTTSVVAIMLGVAPALTLNVTHGIRAINPELIEMAHVFRFSRIVRLRYLWMPAIMPFLFSGARMGFSLAWKVIVLVEVFGLSDGVGYQLNAEFSAQNVAGVLAWTIAFGIAMAVIEYGLLQTVERRLTRWRRAVSV
jgi:NitT/TauT family transport system permease protein